MEVSVSSFGLRVNLIPTERADIEHPQHERLREVRRAKARPLQIKGGVSLTRAAPRTKEIFL